MTLQTDAAVPGGSASEEGRVQTTEPAAPDGVLPYVIQAHWLELSRRATPAPWTLEFGKGCEESDVHGPGGVHVATFGIDGHSAMPPAESRANARLIVALHNAGPEGFGLLRKLPGTATPAPWISTESSDDGFALVRTSSQRALMAGEETECLCAVWARPWSKSKAPVEEIMRANAALIAYMRNVAEWHLDARQFQTLDDAAEEIVMARRHATWQHLTHKPDAAHVEIYALLAAGPARASTIADALQRPRTSVVCELKRLRDRGLIRRVGYGCLWERVAG